MSDNLYQRFAQGLANNRALRREDAEMQNTMFPDFDPARHVVRSGGLTEYFLRHVSTQPKHTQPVSYTHLTLPTICSV